MQMHISDWFQGQNICTGTIIIARLHNNFYLHTCHLKRMHLQQETILAVAYPEFEEGRC